MTKKKLLKSILFSVISLIAVVVVNFFLPRLMPGDPVLSLIGLDEEDALTQQEYDYYYQKMNLDKPLSVQFGLYIEEIFSGNFGYSYHYASNVSDIIGRYIPTTLQIALPSIIISSLIALFFGTYAGYKKGKFGDRFLTASNVVINAFPTFLIGMVLIIVFAYKLDWFPLGGLNSIITPDDPFLAFIDRLSHLFLPILTLVLASTPSRYIMMRNTTATACQDKYVVYLKANGICDNKIKLKHIFKNICAPFITMVGMSFGKMLSGSIVVEMIFSINGMGGLVRDAINSRDFVILQGCLFIIAVMVIIANLITDLICIMIDPRSMYGEAEG